MMCACALATGMRAAAVGPGLKPKDAHVLRSPVGMTEVGLLDGAAYRIDIPKEWNHSLVVFYHGYARSPVTFHIAEALKREQMPFFERHYAVVQSAYSEAGWALQQAYPETEALRRYFVKKYGTPTGTYAVGRSMGGDLVAITLELNPKPYVGGLDLCGSVGPTYQAFDRRFDLRAAFDVYFPGVMPPLVPVPENFEDTLQDRERVLAALKANPTNAALMRNLAGLHSDRDLANDIPYWTFDIGDMQRRSGGNPFDNRNFVYGGTSPDSSASDFALNEAVKRYAATAHAKDYLLRHYTPSGRLGRPMVALHTIYDPVVQLGQVSLYDNEVQAAGAGENLVQQVVDREGHCNFTQKEVGDAFDEVVRWTHGGARPVAGVLKE
ncbi:MAG: alpha/beta hydrolase [Acidobacteria bacterium]|nr:alpha/beta hydrolase [Acidobacteriota bacterium]